MTEQVQKQPNDDLETLKQKKNELDNYFNKKLTESKKTIDQHVLTKLLEVEQKITPLSANIDAINKNITDFKIELDKLETISEEHKNQLINYFEDITKKINIHLTELTEVKSKTDSTYEEINQKHQEIFGYETNIRKKLTTEEIAKITVNAENKNEFNGYLVYQAKDTQGNTYQYILIENRKTGIVDLLNDLKNKITSLINDTNKKVQDFIFESNKTYLELFDKIEEAYKGAIGLSLAKGFNNAKKAHRCSLNFWTVALITSIFLIIGIPSFLEIWIFETKITTLTTINDVYRRILTYLTFIFPLFFFIYICTKNMNGHRRMYEEYLHKESTSLTFEGLKREIGKLPDDKISSQFLQQLLSQSLDATKVNPSIYLDNIKGEQPLSMLSEIISGKNISIKSTPFISSIKIDELFGKNIKEDDTEPEGEIA